MLRFRHTLRLLQDLALGGFRSGLWWMPILVPAMAVAAIMIATAKVAVPTVVYVFF